MKLHVFIFAIFSVAGADVEFELLYSSPPLDPPPAGLPRTRRDVFLRVRFMHSLSGFPLGDHSNVGRPVTALESSDRRTRFRLGQRLVIFVQFLRAPFLPRDALRAVSSEKIIL